MMIYGRREIFSRLLFELLTELTAFDIVSYVMTKISGMTSGCRSIILQIMKRIKIVLAGLTAVAMLVGCKPTEKNYKEAYDAAIQKRNASAEEDAAMNIPGAVLLQVGGPSQKVVNGDTVYFMVERLRFVDGLKGDRHRYNVAVAAYKMQTNCAAQVSDLFAKGYKAFGARNAEEKFYVIAGSFDTLEEAVSFDKAFVKKEKKHVYSGLPSAPVVIEWP